MLKKWLKKIIAESVLENFPPMLISIDADPNKDVYVKLEKCIFRNSQVDVMGFKERNIDVSDSYFEGKNSLITEPEDGQESLSKP